MANRREKRRPNPEDDDENEDIESGETNEVKKDEKREKYLAALRAEGQRRELQAKTLIESVRNRAAARAADGGANENRGDFLLIGDRKKGGEAIVGVRTRSGEIKTILEVLKIDDEKAGKISFVYGDSLGISLEDKTIGDKKTETAKVVIPLDLAPREFPFLLREIARALGALEKQTIARTISKGKGKNKRTEEVISEIDSPIATIIKKEIEARKKFFEGTEGLKKQFSQEGWDIRGEAFRQIREKYKKLETAHSSAWRAAENQVNRLVQEWAAAFRESTNYDYYNTYGSEEALREEILKRTMERQSRLVYPYDDNRNNLLLLGRPGTEAEKIQYLTFTGLFSGLWGPYWIKKAYHGKGWDIPFTDRLKPHLRDSTMVTDYMLRRRLRGYDTVGGSSDEFGERFGNTAKDMSKSFGKAAVELAGILGVVGLATTVELPLRAASAGVNWLDKNLHGLQTWFGKMISKSYKPKPELLSEKEEKARKEFEDLIKKAQGKQVEKK